jgi:hypothetical protein
MAEEEGGQGAVERPHRAREDGIAAQDQFLVDPAAERGHPTARRRVKDHRISEPTGRGQGGEARFQVRHGILEGAHQHEGPGRTPLWDERLRHGLLERDELGAAGRHEVLEQEGEAVVHAALVPIAHTGSRARNAVEEVEIDDVEGAERGGPDRDRREEAEEP